MAFSLSKLSNTQKTLGVILLIALIAGAVWGLSTLNWNSRLQNELKAIDERISSGRVSAGDLVDLQQRRNAILEQI